MLYLINCCVTESYYKGQKLSADKNHIVEADSEEDAIDKLKLYYDFKDVEHHVSHFVDVHYCNEVIV